MDNELMFRLEQAHNSSKEIEEKINLVEQHISELKIFEKGMNEFKNSDEKEILSTVGKGVFIKTEIKERKLFVDVGKGILVKKDFDEAHKISEQQIERLMQMRTELQMQMQTIEMEMKRLLEEVESN